MRARANDGPLSVHAVAGTRVVLLAMDLPPGDVRGLIGFSIARAHGDGTHETWLENFLRLEANADEPTGSSEHNPVQAFVWGDYAVDPGRALRYRVEARYATPGGGLETRHVAAVDIGVEPEDDGRHAIFFNRGAAGSQRYAAKFHGRDPRDDTDAARWLSRGLREAMVAFIERADGPAAGLRGAFYEFEEGSVLHALALAVDRHADVRLVVARPTEKGAPAYPNEENAKAVHDAGLDGVVTWREHSSGIPHNKFLVLTRAGAPVSVWTGSTNVTDGALYGQSNLAHVVHDDQAAPGARVTDAFLRYWEHLRDDVPTAGLRDLDDAENPPPAGEPAPGSVSVVVSPHRGEGILRWLAQRIAHAGTAAFFTAPFGVSQTLEDVLLAPHDFAVYALLDKGDNHMDLLRAAGEQIVSGAYLGFGPWRGFLREALVNRLNMHVQYIHTKYLLVDPLSDDPLVITGSANFSGASVSANDENMLVIRGDTRVADIYLSEFMRLFTHMLFRERATGAHRAAAGDPAPAPRPVPVHAGPAPAPVPAEATRRWLAPDDRWVADWYREGSAKRRERELFG